MTFREHVRLQNLREDMSPRWISPSIHYPDSFPGVFYRIGQVAYIPLFYRREKETQRLDNAPIEPQKFLAVIQNIPSRCAESEVLELIDSMGYLAAVYSFHMPTRMSGRKTHRIINRGFAFVEFLDAHARESFVAAASGHRGFRDRASNRAIYVQRGFLCPERSSSRSQQRAASKTRGRRMVAAPVFSSAME